MNFRLLFFEGPPGAGKSSLSQFVTQQLRLAGKSAKSTERFHLRRLYEGDRFAILGRPLLAEFIRDENQNLAGVLYPFVPDQRFFCPKVA